MCFGDDEIVIDIVGVGDVFVGVFCVVMVSDVMCVDVLCLVFVVGGLTCFSSGVRADVSRARE